MTAWTTPSSNGCAVRWAPGWPSSGGWTPPPECPPCPGRTAPVRAGPHRPGPGGSRAQRDHGRRVPPNAQEEEDLAAAIHAALFGVGRLQPLLDDPHLENIDINGCDRVFLGYADGREVMTEPVAENDDEVVELIQVLAAYSGLSSRPFDSANPQLDLRLPDGARLSAVMDVTLRPSVSIRRARLGKVFLADLVGNGTLLPEAASFLAAAAAARKNIMIAGATNAGKTTLLRAIANEIPAGERIITVERPWSWASIISPSCTRTSSRSRSGCRTWRARARSPWPSWSGGRCG